MQYSFVAVFVDMARKPSSLPVIFDMCTFSIVTFLVFVLVYLDAPCIDASNKSTPLMRSNRQTRSVELPSHEVHLV